MSDKKKIVAIIPARMASSRFPGKPLAKILGLEMIEHVRRRAQLCEAVTSVFVATCDDEIKETVERYGGMAIMTSREHQRCTDRVAEAASAVDADIVVNVQGDEPMITPEMITLLVEPLIIEVGCQVCNLVSQIDGIEEFLNPNVVKTVCDSRGNVLYFSREPIPSGKKTNKPFKPLKQSGAIAFTKDFLMTFCQLPRTSLESIESIDMLRALENGYNIKTVITDEKLYAVDTVEDLRKVESLMRYDKLSLSYIGEKWTRF